MFKELLNNKSKGSRTDKKSRKYYFTFWNTFTPSWSTRVEQTALFVGLYGVFNFKLLEAGIFLTYSNWEQSALGISLLLSL